MHDCPLYLEPYKDLWQQNPRAANLEWFANARYGLFLHYGLYSVMHKHEWSMYLERIPLEKYEQLADQFTAHHFDAEAITDLALQAGMKYINLTTCHHEGFCLWDSKIEPYNSVNSPCGRDLVKELSEACARKGLGFFAYFTFMLHWRHPYFVSRHEYRDARPDYPEPEPRYLYRERADFDKYLDYIEGLIDELLSHYQITGIWFDIISMWYQLGPAFIPIEAIYARIRKKYPGVLIAWKNGATGTEDFASPEHNIEKSLSSTREKFGEIGEARALVAYKGNCNKHNEICSTIHMGSWSYNPMCKNRTADEIYQLLGYANAHNCNLLLNTGPMADGSIHPQQRKILLEVAARIAKDGFPEAGSLAKFEGHVKVI